VPQSSLGKLWLKMMN